VSGDAAPVTAATAAALFDGRRLTVARHLAGLRKNALAERIGRSATAVAGYESGGTRPSPATVARLALALDVGPAFFLPPPAGGLPAGAQAHFRSLRSTTQSARDQAFAFAVVAAEVVAVLERHVELPPLDLPAAPLVVDDEDPAAPEAAARAVRAAWGLGDGPIPHVLRAAEHHGVVVAYLPPQSASVDAYSLGSTGRPLVLLNPAKHDHHRQRFDVAHELGHLVLHADAEPGTRRAEEQANRFAAELLLPAEAVRGELPSRADWRALAELRERWGASMGALLYRARTLGVLRETAYRNATRAMAARGWRRREPGPVRAPEQPSLLPRAVALLAEAGVPLSALAEQCHVPERLLAVVTARTPLPVPAPAGVPSASG